MKIKILFVGASPSDATRLRIDTELREIEHNLRFSNKRDLFEIKQSWATRPRDLLQAMLDNEPQIVHFSGHGTENGICLEDENGNVKVVSNEALTELFKQFSDKLHCVLLNSCYSIEQGSTISNYVKYVIGMNRNVPDNTAIEFSIGFYKALGSGKNYDFAYNIGLTNVKLAGIAGSDIPIIIENSKKMIDLEESEKNTEDTTDLLVKYEYNEREMIVNNDTLCFDVIAKKDVKLKALSSGRDYIVYNLSTGSSTALGYDNFEVELSEQSKRDQGFIELDRRHKSKFKQSFRINFIPALRQGENVEIYLKWTTNSLRFVAFEDFQMAKRNDQLPQDRIDHMFTKKILEDTEHYLTRIIFPKNFPLNSGLAYSAKKKLKTVEAEENRLKDNFKIKKDAFTEKIVLELDVINPIKGITYGLRWIPPKLKDLEKKSFLTKEQSDIIMERNK
jgi:hypothetical protein